MQRSTTQSAGKRRIASPDRFGGRLLILTLFETLQPFGQCTLAQMELFQVHLDIMEFFTVDGEARIHAQTKGNLFPSHTKGRCRSSEDA